MFDESKWVWLASTDDNKWDDSPDKAYLFDNKYTPTVCISLDMYQTCLRRNLELEIISKIIPEFSKKDLYEMEKAKEFGIKKYNELKNYIDNIDVFKKSTKYNI